MLHFLISYVHDQDSHRRRTPLHGLLQQGYQVSEQLAKECFSILLDHEPALPLDLMVKVMIGTNICVCHKSSE